MGYPQYPLEEKFSDAASQDFNTCRSSSVDAPQGAATARKEISPTHSVGRYIVDFYCAECRVAIELDGARHFSITIDEYERSRTRYLEELGITIVRFENRDLLENLEGVLEKIKESLRRVR